MPFPSVRLFFAALPALFGTPFAWAQSTNPIDNLPPGHWYEVPNSNLSALDPCPARNCSYSGIEGQSAVMTNWAGGAYDTTRDRLVVWGGGHGGYAGNEIYAFDVNSLAWQRLTQPSSITANDPAPPNTTTYYADGQPSSRHSYDYLEYAPNVDRFFSVSAAATYGPVGGGGDAVDAFDFDTLTWSARTPVIQASSGYSSTIGSKAIYDSATGYLWYHNCLSGNLKRYDPVGDTWANHVATYVGYYSTAAIDPGRRLLVMVGAGDGTSGNPGIQVWDLANPDTPPISPATQGDAALQNAQAPGFVFDPVNRRFVGWNGGADVYLLQVPASPFTATWTWTRVGPAVGNTVIPTAAEPRGTYGRFRYIPSKHAFIVVNGTNENVYAYRASDLIFKDGFE